MPNSNNSNSNRNSSGCSSNNKGVGGSRNTGTTSFLSSNNSRHNSNSNNSNIGMNHPLLTTAASTRSNNDSNNTNNTNMHNINNDNRRRTGEKGMKEEAGYLTHPLLCTSPCSTHPSLPPLLHPPRNSGSSSKGDHDLLSCNTNINSRPRQTELRRMRHQNGDGLFQTALAVASWPR